MTRRKIVLIGAGSAMFTQGLVADLILTGQPWNLALVDIDPQALAVAKGAHRRMVAARDADITVAGSLETTICWLAQTSSSRTIGVGSRHAWEAVDLHPPRNTACSSRWVTRSWLAASCSCPAHDPGHGRHRRGCDPALPTGPLRQLRQSHDR